MKCSDVLITLYIYMNGHEMCTVLFFFLSAYKTSWPIFTACGYVSGEKTGVHFSSLPLPVLSCALILQLHPLSYPWKQGIGWGSGVEEKLWEGNWQGPEHN